jgi:hypothetical protein
MLQSLYLNWSDKHTKDDIMPSTLHANKVMNVAEILLTWRLTNSNQSTLHSFASRICLIKVSSHSWLKLQIDDVLQKYSTIWDLRHNFVARRIEDALNLTLLNQQRHVEFGHSNKTSSTSELRTLHANKVMNVAEILLTWRLTNSNQ